MYKFIMFSILIFCFGINSLSSVEPSKYVTDGYDIHTYFDMENKDHAQKVFQNFLQFLKSQGIVVASSGFYPKTFERSPHLKPMWEVDLKPQEKLFEKLGIAISWLMLNREGLSIIVHPHTGIHSRQQKILDHTDYALWMGPPVTLNVDPEIFDDEPVEPETN